MPTRPFAFPPAGQLFYVILRIRRSSLQFIPNLFWLHTDTTMEIATQLLVATISGDKKAVITRVLERGSKEEIDEIARFYELSIDELPQFRIGNSYRIRATTKTKLK